MRMLMRHRAGRHDWHAGVQRIPNADAPSCRQKRQARRRATSYECSSAPSCRQKRQTRWHVSWSLRSEAMRAVSSGAVRITACVLFYPMATTRAVKPIRLEMATLIRKHQVLTAPQFILRPLHLRPLTVVVRDFQDGNGICNGDMPPKSEPHGRTFCQVLQKPSRFLWRPTSSITAFLKGASIPQAHFGAPRSGAPFLWFDGCRQLLIRHGK